MAHQTGHLLARPLGIAGVLAPKRLRPLAEEESVAAPSSDDSISAQAEVECTEVSALFDCASAGTTAAPAITHLDSQYGICNSHV